MISVRASMGSVIHNLFYVSACLSRTNLALSPQPAALQGAARGVAGHAAAAVVESAAPAPRRRGNRVRVDATALSGTRRFPSEYAAVVTELQDRLIKHMKFGETDEGIAELYLEARTVTKRLPVVAYNGVLRILASHGDTPGCARILADMQVDGIRATEASYSQLVHAHVGAGDFDAAEMAVQTMAAAKIEPRLRTFAPLALALCEKGSPVAAGKLLKDMIASYAVEPSEELYAVVLSSLAERARAEPESAPFVEAMASVLVDMKASLDYVSVEWLELVEAAMRPRHGAAAGTPDAGDAGVHDVVQGGQAGAQPASVDAACAPAARDFFDAHWVELSPTGESCPRCRARLSQSGLVRSERRAFEAKLAEVALASSEHEERCLSKFACWLRDHPWKFTAVVDGPNVAYYNQNFEGGKFDVGQVQKVVEHLESLGHVVLVVLPAKYCESRTVPNHSKSSKRRTNDDGDSPLAPKEAKGSPSTKRFSLSTEEQAVLSGWYRRGMLYSVRRGCHDDLYWMLATVVCDNAISITNDLVRDHWYKLVGERDYRRWSSMYIAKFSSARAEDAPEEVDGQKVFAPFEPTLALPPPFARQIHQISVEAGETTWHIPAPEDSKRWLCVRVAQP
ncbi:hypothetical protein M885DRAFT_542799 [Pelagophyceae sp. CCMP2097]|nr:hypothetical protein M885DRAFT_542799 [Pelagophyceae sp. CCMP2097]